MRRDDEWAARERVIAGKRERVRALGQKTIPILASFLSDRSLGEYAAGEMRELDIFAAAPYLLRAMPQGGPDSFAFYNWWLTQGRPFAHKRELYAVAVNLLTKERLEGELASEALVAVGLTGSRHDNPLLTDYYRNAETGPFMRTRGAAEASLARLGSRPHLDHIAHQLRMPIPSKLTFEWAWNLSQSLEHAAFTAEPSFLPLIAQHLFTPMPSAQGDVWPPDPAFEAARALNQLANGGVDPRWWKNDIWRPYQRELHDLAVRYLKREKRHPQNLEAEEALLILGYTGNSRDFALLQSFTDRARFDEDTCNQAEASLARLGSAPHLAAIAWQLRQPIPGSQQNWRWDMKNAIENAAFTGRATYIPLLVAILSSNAPPSGASNLPPPAMDATAALCQLTGKGSTAIRWTVVDWQRWARNTQPQ